MQIYLTLYLILNLFIHLIDIVGIYLKSLIGDNEFPIFMRLLPGMHNFGQIQEGLLCQLLRSLYSLKQFGKLWNQNIKAFYKRVDFKQLNRDLSILIRYLEDEISIVNVYVDDFLLALNMTKTLNTLKQSLIKEYDTKDFEEAKTIIGWQINQDAIVNIIKIHQLAYILDLVEEEGLTNCNANVISIKTGSSIEMTDLENYEKVNLHMYQ